MSVTIKSQREITLMREAGALLARVHEELRNAIKPGISTYDIDKMGDNMIRKLGCIPSFLNYNGFPASICVSVNEEVVHGIPGSRKLKDGDIVTLDIGACYKGYHGDSAWTYKVGKVSKEIEYLLEHTEKALYEGLKQVKPGNRIGDIGYAVSEYAKKYNLGVVKELVGHGIGNHVHEDPDVPNYGKKGTGPLLKEGMCIAIEPMLNLGTARIYMLEDDWTIITADGKPSAHYEHTVAVVDGKAEILTTFDYIQEVLGDRFI